MNTDLISTKVVDGIAGFEIIEQRLHGHARAGKHGRAAENVG